MITKNMMTQHILVNKLPSTEILTSKNLDGFEPSSPLKIQGLSPNI